MDPPCLYLGIVPKYVSIRDRDVSRKSTCVPAVGTACIDIDKSVFPGREAATTNQGGATHVHPFCRAWHLAIPVLACIRLHLSTVDVLLEVSLCRCMRPGGESCTAIPGSLLYGRTNIPYRERPDLWLLGSHTERDIIPAVDASTIMFPRTCHSRQDWGASAVKKI